MIALRKAVLRGFAEWERRAGTGVKPWSTNFRGRSAAALKAVELCRLINWMTISGATSALRRIGGLASTMSARPSTASCWNAASHCRDRKIIARLRRNWYERLHGIKISMSGAPNLCAAGSQAPAGAVLRPRQRRAYRTPRLRRPRLRPAPALPTASPLCNGPRP